ncbi:hypothetical protein NE237_031723 [Protea cynaroides]|uniref:Uncharacterized protein n=1 Tax=Protea cynaroides TaxID=273540 RepID=A0A9Q0L2Y7_9MAGN|nr:hypothetical protein NE237_031723 [Protea cynaroides]
MTTDLVQSTASMAFNRSRIDHFEVLLDDHNVKVETLGDGSGRSRWWRSTSASKSKKTKKEAELVTDCTSYRRERAIKRQAFLRTYKLSSSNPASSSLSCAIKSKNLKKLMVKVKSVIVSIIDFVQISSSRTPCKGHPSNYEQ